MYLQPQNHIYKGELHSSPEQLGGFDLLEEALESILQTTQDPHWKLKNIIKSVGRKWKLKWFWHTFEYMQHQDSQVSPSSLEQWQWEKTELR
jgi:hypothetical protein